jgi:uncharacterized membrane protein YfcA
MFLFGIEPRTAIATNMFGLTFMSIGGALPFVRARTLGQTKWGLLISLTLLGSFIGALLVLVIPSKAMPLFVSLSMLAVAGFTLTRKTDGAETTVASPRSQRLALLLTFVLAIYGGFFSGGYVTMLTAVYVALYGMTFVQAVSATKVINVFSSLIASLVFMARGLVDYKLGLALALVMFAGAFVGARIALKLNNRHLRRIFLFTIIMLALKILLYDLFWKEVLR